MYQSMVSDLLESEIGSIFLLLAVMGLGYVTAGWLKGQSRKRRDVVDEAAQMRRELEALRQEMQTKKKLEELPKVEISEEDVTLPAFMSPCHPFISGGNKGSFAFSDASTAVGFSSSSASSTCGSASAGEGLETDDSAGEEEEEGAAEVAK